MHTLFQFRKHKPDTYGMFLQAHMMVPDQPSVQFKYREAPKSVFVFTKRCETYSGQKTAADEPVLFTNAARALTLQFYMDEYVHLPQAWSALQQSKDQANFPAIGCFKLIHFASSSPTFTAELNAS